MKKKWFFSIVLVIALLLSVTACAGGAAEETEDENIVKSIELQLEEREDKTVLEEVLENKPEPLHICVDLDFTDRIRGETETKGVMASFVGGLGEAGGPTDVVVDIIPADLPENEGARMSMLTRLRAEIMSGAGPDVFIMATGGSSWGDMGEPLFSIPEKTMANGIFLPLDEYIENAQFMEWDKFLPVVMEAGRDEYGQQLIPLTYTLPLTFFHAEDVPEKFGAETTWQDMLETESGALAAASTWFHAEAVGLSSMTGHYMDYTFGALADYSAEKLLFTEEELLQRVIEVMEQEKQYAAGTLPEAPVHYQTTLRANWDESGSRQISVEWSDGLDPYVGIGPKDAKTMVPIYSDDGGITATILHYAAVNANTQRPDDAFFVIDYLLSTSNQQRSSLYGYILTRVNGMPVHSEIGSPELPCIYDSVFGIWYMTEENFAEFTRVRDQITHARFRGGLDTEISDMYYQCRRQYLYNMESDQTLEEIAAEYYRRMERMLAE